jgi:hypothetical protein
VPLAASLLADHANDESIIQEVDDAYLEVASAGLSKHFVAQYLKAGLIAIDLFDLVVLDGVLAKVWVRAVNSDLDLLAQQLLVRGIWNYIVSFF